MNDTETGVCSKSADPEAPVPSTAAVAPPDAVAPWESVREPRSVTPDLGPQAADASTAVARALSQGL